MEHEPHEQRWVKRAAEVWTVIGVLVLLAGALMLLGRITSALIPFGMALVIVLVLRAPVDLLEKRGVPRGLGVLIAYVATIVVVTVVMFVLVPMLAQQVEQFGSKFPEYTAKGYQLYLDLAGRFSRANLPSFMTEAVQNVRDSVTKWAVSSSAAVASGAVDIGSQIATLVFDGLIALLIAFYVLLDFHKMRGEVLGLFGEQSDHADHFMSISGRVLGGYLRGVVLDGLSVFAMTAVGLSILQVPGAIVIAVFAGLVNVIPYLGPALAMALAGLAGLFVSPWLGLWAVVVVLVATQVDSLVLNPRIMSGQVDLHPVLVVFSLLTGATLFGVAGMILAIPVAAIGKAVFMYLYEVRTGTDLATEGGALFKEAKGDEDLESAPPESPPAEGPPADGQQ